MYILNAMSKISCTAISTSVVSIPIPVFWQGPKIEKLWDLGYQEGYTISSFFVFDLSF